LACCAPWLSSRLAGLEVPGDEAIAAALGQGQQVASSTISSVQPHRDVVKRWHDAGVQGRAIHAATRVTIDNAKCAIVKACSHDPLVQRAYAECAEGYSFKIDACPPRDPQKKALISYCTSDG
jgi:hypothetical protein